MTYRCDVGVQAKLNICLVCSTLNKLLLTVWVCVLNYWLLCAEPVRMTLQFRHRLINVVIEICLMGSIVEFLREGWIVNITLTLWIEVVCEIVYLPILENCHAFQFISQLRPTQISIFILIKILENCFCFRIQLFTTYLIQAVFSNLLIIIIVFRWTFKRSQCSHSSIKSGLSIRRCLVKIFFEIIRSDFLCVVVIEVWSVAIVMVFWKVYPFVF